MILFFILNKDCFSQTDSIVFKKIVSEFDFNNPSWFLNGFIETGFFELNTDSSFSGSRMIQFTKPDADPVYKLRLSRFPSFKGQLIIKKSFLNSPDSQITYYKFSNWNNFKRLPTEIIKYYRNYKGETISESEKIYFDKYFNPILLKHYYRNSLVYEETITISPKTNNYSVKLERKNVIGNRKGLFTLLSIFVGVAKIKITNLQHWDGMGDNEGPMDSMYIYYEKNGLLGRNEELKIIEKYYHGEYIILENDPLIEFYTKVDNYSRVALKKIVVFYENNILTTHISKDNYCYHVMKTIVNKESDSIKIPQKGSLEVYKFLTHRSEKLKDTLAIIEIKTSWPTTEHEIYTYDATKNARLSLIE